MSFDILLYLGNSVTAAKHETAVLQIEALKMRETLDAKLEQKVRVAEIIEVLKYNISHKDVAIAHMHEQTYDIR